MIVHVASKNPVKQEAVKQAFEVLFPEIKLQISGFSTDSGVSDQPSTDAETYQGARNRVDFIRRYYPGADYWVGIEGGIDYHEGQAEAFAWVVIQSRERTGKARSCSFQLPDRVDQLLKEGYELGEANDQVFREANSKQKGGAVGSLTNGAVTRTALYVQPVKLALIPMITPNLFAAD